MGVSHGRCRELQLGNPLLDLGLTNVSDATATPFRFDIPDQLMAAIDLRDIRFS